MPVVNICHLSPLQWFLPNIGYLDSIDMTFDIIQDNVLRLDGNLFCMRAHVYECAFETRSHVF